MLVSVFFSTSEDIWEESWRQKCHDLTIMKEWLPKFYESLSKILVFKLNFNCGHKSVESSKKCDIVPESNNINLQS